MLFGSKALRGPASDYKTFEGEMTFELRGNTYTIRKKGTKAELFLDEDQVATGTKPVSEKIIGLFGYGLDVFDVANNCGQGQIEAISAMKPTERKALVDRTIGLTAVDTTVTKIAEDISQARTRVATLEEGLIEPVEPEKPEGYQPSNEIEERIGRAREDRDLATQAQAWLDARDDLTEPVEPEEPEGSLDLDELREHERKRNAAMDEVEAINDELKALDLPTMKMEQVEAAEEALKVYAEWQAEQTLKARHPKPDFTAEQLDNIERAQKADTIRGKIAMKRDHETLECPNCEHEWVEDQEAIDELVRQIPLYDDESLPDTYEFVNVLQERHRLTAYEAVADKIKDLPQPPEPKYTEGQLKTERKRFKNRERQTELHHRYAELVNNAPKPRTEELENAEKYYADLASYRQEKGTWDRYVSARDSYREQLKKAEANKDDIDELMGLFKASAQYEQSLQAYQAQKTKYERDLEVYQSAKHDLEQWVASRKALRDLKAKVKTHLLPSLNTVASVLINQMTGGQRNKIRIDEDFEVLVDGQSLETLSGSGKAVANLAMRLGLGQVLTNKTFSVFMADEIDAAMDADRAGFTADSLSKLTKSIDQILLVSHKSLTTQHHIELGKHDDNADTRRAGNGGERAA
jgi:DNA repair exonuclease SbcCD ATPase subunit